MDKQEKEIVKRNEVWIKESLEEIKKAEKRIRIEKFNVKVWARQSRTLKGRE